jgi:hypothetical protein
MVRKILLSLLLVLVLAFAIVGPAFADPNPNGTGQPSQSCGSPTATNMPNGFNTSGFAKAESVYAGSPGTPSAANGSSHAVSQYDVACYQVTNKGK